MGYDVLATDGNEGILEYTRLNLLENVGDTGTWDVKKLWWGEKNDIDKNMGMYDLIVAADVLSGDYLAMTPFIETLRLLSGENTEVLIAQMIRYPENEEKFLEELSKEFQVERIQEKGYRELGIIEIYRLRNK